MGLGLLGFWGWAPHPLSSISFLHPRRVSTRHTTTHTRRTGAASSPGPVSLRAIHGDVALQGELSFRLEVLLTLQLVAHSRISPCACVTQPHSTRALPPGHLVVGQVSVPLASVWSFRESLRMEANTHFPPRLARTALPFLRARVPNGSDRHRSRPPPISSSSVNSCVIRFNPRPQYTKAGRAGTFVVAVSQ